ncbi:MAG: hypothetical protein EZS28_054575, partial [Streblomastix strix]
LERRDGSPFKAYPQQASRGKSYRLDYPEQEKGTLSGQMTEYLSNIEPVTVDFSNIRSDSPQLRDIFGSGTTFVTIANSMLTNCSAAINGMIATSEHEEELMSKSSQTSLLQTQTNSNQKSNQLYDDGQPVYDDLYKHGHLFVVCVNYDMSGMISAVKVVIQKIFSGGYHSAVGSEVSIQKMRLD